MEHIANNTRKEYAKPTAKSTISPPEKFNSNNPINIGNEDIPKKIKECFLSKYCEVLAATAPHAKPKVTKIPQRTCRNANPKPTVPAEYQK